MVTNKDGCEVHSTCFECPLPDCRYGIPGGAAHFKSELRHREIRELQKLGWTIAELAARFGLAKRSIHRALKERHE